MTWTKDATDLAIRIAVMQGHSRDEVFEAYVEKRTYQRFNTDVILREHVAMAYADYVVLQLD